MRTQDHLNDAIIAPIRGLHSLRDTHADAVRLGVAAAAPEWLMDQHDDYDGNMMLMITPPQVDLGGPSFVLYGTHNGVQLGVIQDDSFEDVLVSKTLAPAIRHLQWIIANRADIQ